MKNLLLFTAFLFFISNPMSAQKSAGYKVGDMASDFKLLDVSGEYVSLANFEDVKGFVIVFTCNHCPFSIANEDRLITLDKTYKELGYPVIAINPNDPKVVEDDSYDKMKERAKEKGFTFPYLFDEGQKVYPMYGATKTPHVYVLQKSREGLVVKYIGAIDDNARDESKVKEHFLENALKDLIEGREPKVATTKAIGCSIKTAEK